MYHACLRPRTLGDDTGCRGSLFDGEDYLLEIAGDCNCRPELLALAAHEPELLEFLDMSTSPIATMLRCSIKELTKKLTER